MLKSTFITTLLLEDTVIVTIEFYFIKYRCGSLFCTEVNW
jgi:hypothetical protein